jgi:hypothetical protein
MRLGLSIVLAGVASAAVGGAYYAYHVDAPADPGGPPESARREGPGRPFPGGEAAARAVDGERLDLRAPADGVTAVVFYSAECPIAAEALPRVAEIGREHPTSRLRVVGVCVDPDASAEAVAEDARGRGLDFPIVHDRGGDLACRFGVRVVPEAFVIGPGPRLLYRGRVDDRYAARGRRRPGPASEDLRLAVGAALAGRPVSSEYLEPVGCPAPERRGPAADAAPAEEVAAILRRSCCSCHRPGGPAPFSLMTHGQAAKRAGDLADVVEAGRMPPWGATPGMGPPLLHDRSLLPSEIAAIRAWADAGAPEWPAEERSTVGGAATEDDGWALGRPDLVLEMSEAFDVPATGGDVYRCFVLPTDLPEGRFLSAVEVRPGNRLVVHHTFGYIDGRGLGRARDQKDPGPGYSCFSGFQGDSIFGAIGGWTPGNEPRPFGEGIGLHLPRGADVVLQVHYSPSGKPETDRTLLGLHFARSAVKQSLQWVSACPDPGTFVLDAGENGIRISTRLVLPMDVDLHAMTPHMHLLGRSLEASVERPDGRVEPLIRVADWDFNRQETYYLREPLRLPEGSVVRIEGVFDNTAANPLNPNRPPREVRWGEATTDDMLILFLALTDPAQDLTHPGANDGFMEEFFRRAGGGAVRVDDGPAPRE